MGHTPGPWRAEGAEIVWLDCPDNQCVVADVLSEEYAADAHLIAAAPELLAALKELREFVADNLFFGPEATRADQAIAKAEGRRE